jgi:periplasmic divalent cation tolerance protein
LIKTSVEKLDALEAAVRGMHSYDVPEFVVLQVQGGSQAYLRWLYESLE